MDMKLPQHPWVRSQTILKHHQASQSTRKAAQLAFCEGLTALPIPNKSTACTATNPNPLPAAPAPSPHGGFAPGPRWRPGSTPGAVFWRRQDGGAPRTTAPRGLCARLPARAFRVARASIPHQEQLNNPAYRVLTFTKMLSEILTDLSRVCLETQSSVLGHQPCVSPVWCLLPAHTADDSSVHLA